MPKIPKFPTYQPYGTDAGTHWRGAEELAGFGYQYPGRQAPMPTFPTAEMPTMEEYPEVTPMPTYEPGVGAYPITQLPAYKSTPEAYPEYRAPADEVSRELMTSIRERMAGEGTAGAESAIYERGEDRVQIEYEEGLKRIDEQMAARGLTGSGIHGEAVEKLETERQRSLADLSRQITIYGQQAIESAMAKGQQYVAYQSAEAQRELVSRERGWAGRTQERIRGFESEARAAEARGASEQAAYNTAIAERVRSYEAQARAWSAKTETQRTKWTDKANLAIRKYQIEMEKAQLLQQAKMTSWQVGREEYRRVYESRYQATRDTYIAQRDAEEAARQKENDEWRREKERIELQIKRRTARYEEFKGGLPDMAGFGGGEPMFGGFGGGGEPEPYYEGYKAPPGGFKAPPGGFYGGGT